MKNDNEVDEDEKGFDEKDEGEDNVVNENDVVTVGIVDDKITVGFDVMILGFVVNIAGFEDEDVDDVERRLESLSINLVFRSLDAASSS